MVAGYPLLVAGFFWVTKNTPVKISVAATILTMLRSSFPKPMAIIAANKGCRYMKTATVVGFNSRIDSKFSKYVQNVEKKITKPISQ